MHKPVAYFIVPLFALANTAIVLNTGWASELSSQNSMGIIAGLVIGKPVGILVFCFLLTKLAKIKLPEEVQWRTLTGAAVLGGIGFTMSIFISNLAFTDEVITANSKIAVLIASVAASVIGLAILFTAKTKK